MAGLDTFFLVLAILSAAIGVGLMIAMANYLQTRGQDINWVFLRLFILKYVSQYRYTTIKESGRSGPLFYPFVVSMNLALLFAVLGLVLQ